MGKSLLMQLMRKDGGVLIGFSWGHRGVTHDDIMSSLVEYNIDDVKRRQTQTLVNIFQGIEDVSFLDHCS